MTQHTCRHLDPLCPECDEESVAIENFGVVLVEPEDGKGFSKGQIRLFPLEPFTRDETEDWNGY